MTRTGLPADFSDEEARVRALRMQLLEHHPFWGFLLLQVKIVLDPELPAIAATDCLQHIWLNPLRTRALTTGQLGFALAHEVGHQVYATLARARGRNHHYWNCATDYAINRMVAEIPHPARHGPLYQTIPGILLDRRFDGLIAESIYERLVSEAAEAGSGEGEGAEVLSAAGRSVQDHHGGIDVHLPAGLGDEEREEIESRIRAAVAEHRAHESRGHVPGEVLRALEEGRARIPWRRVLRQYLQAALDRDDLDPRRPNRRWLTEGFVVPGLGGERVGLAIIALDTSGSVSNELLGEAFAEIRSIAAELADLRVVVADAKVQQVLSADNVDSWLAARRARGGGGTDHRPVFDWVRRERLQPDVFVGITDLHTELPKARPPYPVVWVCPKRHGKAPWGRVIETQ